MCVCMYRLRMQLTTTLGILNNRIDAMLSTRGEGFVSVSQAADIYVPPLRTHMIGAKISIRSFLLLRNHIFPTFVRRPQNDIEKVFLPFPCLAFPPLPSPPLPLRKQGRPC